jgi:EAL domain-containing protein (putative c-di-GMP-specific phosphodiesterase class I)
LKKLPVNELKIDQSFIKDMEKSQNDEVIVHSTIELAHNLGLSVVAEGVESKETLKRLALLGCDTAQGFIISRPLTFEQMNELLDATRARTG